jgi:hypothetical protein
MIMRMVPAKLRQKYPESNCRKYLDSGIGYQVAAVRDQMERRHPVHGSVSPKGAGNG